MCSVHKDFRRIPLLTQKLKTTSDKSQPAYSIIQKKKIQAKEKQFFGFVFFLPRILQRRKFLDACGQLHQGEARVTSAFQLLLSRELLKKSEHDLGLLRKSLFTKGF